MQVKGETKTADKWGKELATGEERWGKTVEAKERLRGELGEEFAALFYYYYCPSQGENPHMCASEPQSVF